jgi:hypothetical protein
MLQNRDASGVISGWISELDSEIILISISDNLEIISISDTILEIVYTVKGPHLVLRFKKRFDIVTILS